MPTCTVPATSATRMTTAPRRAQLLRQARELTSTSTNHLPLCHILQAISPPRVVQPGWSSAQLILDPDVMDPDQPAPRRLGPCHGCRFRDLAWRLSQVCCGLPVVAVPLKGELHGSVLTFEESGPRFAYKETLAYFDYLLTSLPIWRNFILRGREAEISRLSSWAVSRCATCWRCRPPTAIERRNSEPGREP
jgi:hypothetical protein